MDMLRNLINQGNDNMARYVLIDLNGAEIHKQELFNDGKKVKSRLERFRIKHDEYGRECIYVDGLKYYVSGSVPYSKISNFKISQQLLDEFLFLSNSSIFTKPQNLT